MENETKYESGIVGVAEVRFGGKICVDVGKFDNSNTHVIGLSEFYVKGKPGGIPDFKERHRPQVFLMFDNIKSVEIMERALMTLREDMKREAEEASRSVYEGVFSKKLTDCELPVRTLNICMRIGLKTIGDVAKMEMADWLTKHKGGKKSFEDLNRMLTEHGLWWGMNKPEQTNTEET